MKRFIWQLATRLLLKAGITIERVRPASAWAREGDRFSYQKEVIGFEDRAGQRVLDIGSGGLPFPYATVLLDRFPARSNHRDDDLVTNGKPFVIADIDRLPFSDHAFDYVCCSHVLEHVPDPIAACREIMRIGKRGYIETPTLGKDMLFAWAKGMHRWHVVGIGHTLCFFEYDERQSEGIRSKAWSDVIFGKWWHPLQDAFEHNQDVFNVMLNWSSTFNVFVFYLDGRVASFTPARPPSGLAADARATEAGALC